MAKQTPLGALRRNARQGLVFLTVFLAGLTLTPLTAADPIIITGGAIVLGPGLGAGGSLNLVGTRDFSITGHLAGNGAIGPKGCAPCVPGDAISMGSAKFGLDLLGMVARLEGQDYPRVGGMTSGNNLPIVLDAPTLTAPGIAVGSPVTLTTPFTFESVFSYSSSPTGFPTSLAPVSGSGLATLTLSAIPSGMPGEVLWHYTALRYDFGTTEPVPEPASLLLLGSGLALVGRRAWRRNGGRN